MYFYLYGDNNIQSLPLSFDFTVSGKAPVTFPAFLLFDMENDSTAVLCKIKKATNPTYGMTISVSEVREIQINLTALLNSILPSDPLPGDSEGWGYTDGRQLIREWYDKLFALPPDKSKQIVNVILKRNPEIVEENYFKAVDSGLATTDYANENLPRPVSDAIYSAFKFFGRRDFISQITEEGILDFDLNTLFSRKQCVTEDNKHCFLFNGKKLYLHKVHRLAIEKCLGVDLIYNFMDERRAVFVQYKCTRADGRFYHRSDRNFASELDRMKGIPGIQPCVNFQEESITALRLCRCPVFVKVCRKTSSRQWQRETDSVYFPVCIVDRLRQRQKPASIRLRDRPHFTNEQFQELVRGGFIGSTPEQSKLINEHLVETTQDERLKLIFEEVRDS